MRISIKFNIYSNVLSGAGRKAVVYEGAGFLDEVKKGYNKTKSVVKSETGQK